MDDRFESTRRSWNQATRNHNAHKGDQAAFFRGGGDTLFAEELELLGPLAGRRLVHLQCNAGQDTLSLARRGAIVTGVDLSDEAIAFARQLAADAEIAATFVEAEVLAWMAATDQRFDLAFASYGAIGWLPDLAAWAAGVRRILAPGGRLVLVEFHPLVWSINSEGALRGDDYFSRAPFIEPVGDYVQTSGPGLGAREVGETVVNEIPAYSYQYGLAETVSAVIGAGLTLERLIETPHSNGCRVNPTLVLGEGRRYVWPAGAARVPLMFGLAATRPDE